MGLTEATATAFRNYFKFSGRASRSEYWKFLLFILLGSIALIIINSLIFGPEETKRLVLVQNANGTKGVAEQTLHHYSGGILGTLFFLACLCPLLSAGWRRLHDTNTAGWWLLVPAATLIVVVSTTILLTVGPTAAIAAISQGMEVKVHLSGAVALIVALLVLAPAVLVLLRLIRKSDPGPNSYGPNPLEVTK